MCLEMCSNKMLMWFSLGCGISYRFFFFFNFLHCIFLNCLIFFTVNVSISQKQKKALFLKNTRNKGNFFENHLPYVWKDEFFLGPFMTHENELYSFTVWSPLRKSVGALFQRLGLERLICGLGFRNVVY